MFDWFMNLFHRHEWEDIHESSIRRGTMITGYIYIQKCSKCKKIREFRFDAN